MRIVALLIAVAATEVEFRTNYDAMMEATRWLMDGGAPPAHWVVHGESDLDDLKHNSIGGGTKEVGDARFRNTSVVVKTMKQIVRKRRGVGPIFAELSYLEYCRGGPGIPKLLGGYYEGDRAFWVVEKLGSQIGKNPSWNAFVEAAPLDAARAIFRCFRSFAEIGGFILNDFTEQQFTYFEGALYLVDGPLFATGPAREFADGVLTNVKTGDVLHQLSLGFRFMSSAQNSYKKHVHDVATKPYLLPFVISSSEGDDRAKLEALSAAMTRPDPDARPSFTKLLAALG